LTSLTASFIRSEKGAAVFGVDVEADPVLVRVAAPIARFEIAEMLAVMNSLPFCLSVA
jgi:hypothetical protein